jgi:hypothetical protein
MSKLWRRSLRFGAVCAAFAVIGAAGSVWMGWVPFLGAPTGLSIRQAGWGIDFANGGSFLYANNTGYPSHPPVPFGLPLYIAHGLLLLVTNWSPEDTQAMTYLGFLIAAAAGFYWLAIQLKAGTVLSAFGALLWLSQPIVWWHAGYGALGVAFALLPLYLASSVATTRLLIRSASLRTTLLACALLAAVSALAAFMDGYTFIMFAAATGCLVVAELWRCQARLSAKESIKTLVLSGSSILAGVALYLLYIPQSTGYQVEPLEVFRAMGVDLMTAWRPCHGMVWLWDYLEASGTCSRRHYFGDESAFSTNYVGWSLFALAVLGVLAGPTSKKLRIAITFIAVAAFIGSLGPSLKAASYRDQDLKGPIGYDYYMPAEAAHFAIPLASYVRYVPGFRNMRAIYRWQVLFKVMLILSALIGLRFLHRRLGYAVVIPVCLIIVMDSLPSPERALAKSEATYASREAFRDDAIEPLRDYISPSEIVVFWPLGNDFIAHYAAPYLNVRAYNVGGDKNLRLAWRSYPTLLVRAFSGDDDGRYLGELAACGQLDKVIYPFFDMNADVHRTWPLSDQYVDQYRKKHQLWMSENRVDQYFHVSYTKYAAVHSPILTNATGRSCEDL